MDSRNRASTLGSVFHLALVVWIASIAMRAYSQGTRADYQRAADLRRLTENKVFRTHLWVHWTADGKHLWYRVDTGPGQYEFVRFDTEKPGRHPAFDHPRLAAAMNKTGWSQVHADQLPIDDLEFDPAGQYFDCRSKGQWWRCKLPGYELSPGPARQSSTDGKGPSAGETLQPVDEVPKASTHTGPDVVVTFVNRMPSEVEMVWLDPQGRRHGYGKLRPGDMHDQPTFAGHVWLMLDPKGRPLGAYEAEKMMATVEITADPPHAGRDPAATGVKRPGRHRPLKLPDHGSRSPDGRWLAFIKNHNLWAKETAGGEEFALSDDGTEEDAYGERFAWSPDSQKLVAVRTRKGEDRQVSFIESSPPDQLQPKLHTFSYAKPGDRIAVDKPQLFHVPSKKHIPVSDELFPNPWSIGDIHWAKDSRRFTFVYNQRGHQVLRLLAVDAASGAVRPTIDEQSPTFIDYSGKYFLEYLDGSRELIWMSERDGWNHLYLYDADGKLKNQITKGPWVVRGVDRVDPAKRQVWFRAGGIRPEQDPYYISYCRVNFDGSGLVVLTPGDGSHSIEFSPDREFFLDTYSRVDLPPVTELRRSSDGSLLGELERADGKALLAAGWKPPKRLTAKGRDGTTDIYGVLFGPTNFDPHKTYPVIESIYAGPHDSAVPKRFHSFYPEQAMAELGFIVVKIDGMGTSNRSKKFHDVCWKNLADAGFPDRILWIKAAAAKYPCMDLTRVGIYGGSAGGQNAAGALMTHGDFYKVAVADCGCHDNRMDKIWWNEQWMGWPVGPQYAANSNVTLARGLQGKLLLIVGEMDTNVDPASTMQVVNALVKADKDFDLLVIPGSNHGAAEGPYASRRRADYFVRNLLRVEPRSR